MVLPERGRRDDDEPVANGVETFLPPDSVTPPVIFFSVDVEPSYGLICN